jgi:hypothetical protein
MNITNLIDNFIKKILEDECENLEEKLLIINRLLDNLIDYCIKKKIFYYIENKIKYNDIVNYFKNNLFDFLKLKTDPEGNLLKQYCENDINNFDNFSDINSLLFTKFKNSSKKNVLFSNNITIMNDDITFNNNIDPKYILKSENEINRNLSIYIKFILSQNKYIVEFIEYLTILCEDISNNEKILEIPSIIN